MLVAFAAILLAGLASYQAYKATKALEEAADLLQETGIMTNELLLSSELRWRICR